MNAGAKLGALVLLIVWVSGCVGQEIPRRTRYLLQATHAQPATPLDLGNLRVGRVPVNPLFERKSFVYRTDEHAYESDFYHEFYSPPGVLVRQTIEEWMSATKIFTAVLGSTDSRHTDWVLESQVDKLYVDLRKPGTPESVLEIEFTIVRSGSPNLDVVFQKVYFETSPVPDQQRESFVAGWREGLSSILTSLESDLRTALAETRPLPPIN
jgi:ABC-type uncharacterized transport system auxiliary subunit